MSGVSKQINEALVEGAKASLKVVGNRGAIGIKLQAIISSAEHGIKQVAEVFGVTRRTVYSWIKSFNSGVDELNVKPGRGRPRALDAVQIASIQKWLAQDSCMTIMGVKLRLEEEFGITVGTTAVHQGMKQAKFSYQTPRPQHYKSDPVKQEEFKKNYRNSEKVTKKAVVMV